jgi:hypothetical protein
MQPLPDGWFGLMSLSQRQEFAALLVQNQTLFAETRVQLGRATLDNDLLKSSDSPTEVSLERSIDHFRSQADPMKNLGDAYTQIAANFDRMADILESLRQNDR